MRDVQELIEIFQKRKVIIGPDHFVLGDGYGNPGMHSSLFVDADRFYQSFDLHEECVRRIIEQLGDVVIDLVVTPDDQSVPTARLLRRILAGIYKIPELPVISMESDKLPESGGIVLIHDDVINRGRQVQEVLNWLSQGPFRAVAISSLFTRIEEKKILDLPVVAAVDRVMSAVPAEACPLCKQGIRVNPDFGKGALYIALETGEPLPIKVSVT